MRETLRARGLFSSLYTDRGSRYGHTPVAGGKVDRANPTQFGRVMGELGIKMIPSYSPEARGRSERFFGTVQGRLSQELALEGIARMAEANRYLGSRSGRPRPGASGSRPGRSRTGVQAGVQVAEEGLSVPSVLDGKDAALLSACLQAEASSKALQTACGYAGRTRSFERRLGRMLAEGLLAMTDPAKPRSPRQRYRLTDRGRAALES